MQRFSVGELVITAPGLTVTVTVNTVPAQPPTLGVMEYITAIGLVVAFISVSVIAAVAPLFDVGVMLGTSALDQLNVAVELLLVIV